MMFRTGPKEELQQLLDALKAEEVFVRELSTSEVAYHSPLLDPVLPKLSAGERRAHQLLQAECSVLRGHFFASPSSGFLCQ